MKELYAKLCGIGFSHKKGYIYCDSINKQCYLFAFFTTDFIAETRDGLKYGKANSFILFEPFSSFYHTDTGKGKSGFTDNWCFFYGNDAKNLIDRLGIKTNEIYFAGSAEVFTELIKKIRHELGAKQINSKEKTEAYLTLLLLEISDIQKSASLYSNIGRIADVREQMLKDYNKKQTVEELAALAGYSCGHFAQCYKKAYGKGPIEELIDYRLEQSKIMLESNLLSVSVIASRCGFSSLYYYSRMFKKKFGISPKKHQSLVINSDQD